MAFNVVLYTFSKKQNSTAQPATAALTVSCTAKLPLDVVAPTIQLQLTGGAAANPSAYNYAYISSFSRYYWIRSWRNVGPLWEAELTCDVLASWKASIGNQTCYVYRSAYAYNNKLVDNKFPVTCRTHKLNVDLPKVWTIGGANENGAAENSGFYILGIITSSGTVYGAFTPSQLDTFLTALFDGDFYDEILGTFGATEYPEAKVAINPIQYISSIKFVPGSLISSGYWGIRYIDLTMGISVGPVSLSYLQTPVSWYRLTSGSNVVSNSFSIYDIELTSDFFHPQADERGDWLNMAPYTNYELFYPPFGLLQLDPAIISQYTYLRIRLSLDVRTTTATLDVQVYDTTANIRTILRQQAQFGVDVPLSNIIQPGTSAMQMISNTMSGVIGAVGGALTGNWVGAATSAFSAVNAGIGTAVEGQIPHLSTIGGPGNVADLHGYPKLYVTHWYMADDDLADFGRPLCSSRQISAIPGFIICDSDHVAIACTSQELAEIKAAMQAGFYYE